MSIDNIALYVQAKTDLDKASAEVRRLTKLITNVADTLNSERPLWVSGVKVKRPPEQLHGREFTFAAKDWPDADHLAEALASKAYALRQVNSYWGGLIASEKKNLIPPSLSTKDCNE